LTSCWAAASTWLVNAHDVKHLPGRPKTDRLDAVCCASSPSGEMLRPSFVPPPAIRQLRDLTRYRVDLLAVRTAEKKRVEKLLEDALIKLSVVVSDPFKVSGRAMMAALIAGQRDPGVLADLARGTLRSTTARLREALTGMQQSWPTRTPTGARTTHRASSTFCTRPTELVSRGPSPMGSLTDRRVLRRRREHHRSRRQWTRARPAWACPPPSSSWSNCPPDSGPGGQSVRGCCVVGCRTRVAA
jgi:hypothetical protein